MPGSWLTPTSKANKSVLCIKSVQTGVASCTWPRFPSSFASRHCKNATLKPVAHHNRPSHPDKRGSLCRSESLHFKHWSQRSSAVTTSTIVTYLLFCMFCDNASGMRRNVRQPLLCYDKRAYARKHLSELVQARQRACVRTDTQGCRTIDAIAATLKLSGSIARDMPAMNNPTPPTSQP